MNDLTVSVIIPTKDRPQMLGRAIESVLRQTYAIEKIIIIDDASTTNYLEEVVKNFNRNSLIYQRLDKPSGASIARNTGAKLARGDILMFLDDDDIWMPSKVENQVRILENRSEVGLVYSGRKAVNENGSLLFTVTPKHEGQIYRALLKSNCIGITSSVAIRANIFWQAGGFDPDMPGRQDYDLWVRIAKFSAIAFDSQLTVEWTVHREPGKQMNSKPWLYEQAVKRFLQKYARDLETLSPIERRKAYASQYALLADKYAQTGSLKQYLYVLQSLLQYPSLAAFVRLLPYSLFLQLRKLTNK